MADDASAVATEAVGTSAPAEVAPAPDPGPPSTAEPGTTPWTHQLTNAERHTDPALTRYQDLNAFVDGHIELSKTLGSKVNYPGEDATPEDWQAFYSKVPGYPETPEAYSVLPPEMPEELAPTPEEHQQALGRFHQLGLTNSQAEGVLTLLAETNALRAQQGTEALQAQMDTAYDTLRALPGWGPLTDRNLAVAQEGLRREFGDDAAASLGDLANNPTVAQLAFHMGQTKGHGRFVPGGSNMESVDAARAAIEKAHADHRAGAVSDAERDAVITRHGPLAYSKDTPGTDFARGGASHGPPSA